KQVVEIDDATATLLELIPCVYVGEFLGRSGKRATCAGRGERELVGCDHARLGPFDFGGDIAHGARGPSTAHPSGIEEPREKPGCPVEDARCLAARFFGAPAQLRERERVERTRGDGTVDAEAREAPCEFSRGFAGEGDGEDPARVERTAPGAPR